MTFAFLISILAKYPPKVPSRANSGYTTGQRQPAACWAYDRVVSAWLPVISVSSRHAVGGSRLCVHGALRKRLCIVEMQQSLLHGRWREEMLSPETPRLWHRRLQIAGNIHVPVVPMQAKYFRHSMQLSALRSLLFCVEGRRDGIANLFP